MIPRTYVDVLLIFKHLSEIFRNTIFSQKFSNGEIIYMRLKKKLKQRPGGLEKKIHPAGLPETSLYFFWPYN